MPAIRRMFASLALAASVVVPRLPRTIACSSVRDDAGFGTAAAPWRSIDRVNRGGYVPGDRILFQRGAKFIGNL